MNIDPKYEIDSQKAAIHQLDSNKKDSREVLEGLFKNTNNSRKQQTKTMDKALSNKRLEPGTKSEKETGNPLLKTASFTLATRLSDSSSAAAVMSRAFLDELGALSV